MNKQESFDSYLKIKKRKYNNTLHNPYNEYKSDAHARQLQCVFLYNICNEEYDVIYQLVSFTIQRNTMRIYTKNIILLEEAKDFFL